jgi:aspartyl-tRNA(Asn)/glutamyl-tRNA(Gln) amidotransferase subunit A
MTTGIGQCVPDSLVDAVGMLRAGEVSSEELVRRYLARIDRLDAGLGAFVARFDDRVLAAARDADAALAAGERRRPLLGVPIAVKDIIASREAETLSNSEVRNPLWTARGDSAVVARLRGAGAIVLGKLTTNEFALGGPDPAKPFPVPHNPWNPARTAGGSSSGSGIAVAAGLCAAALGSDTGGSIRLPSAWNGITGFVPTFGVVPTDGVVPLSWSLDRVGPMARTAADCAAVFGALSGRGPSRPAPDVLCRPDLTGIQVAIVRDQLAVDGADPAAAVAVDEAERALRALGATVVSRSLTLYTEIVAAAVLTLFGEAFDAHRELLASRWHMYGWETRLALVRGAFISASDYVRAQRLRTVAKQLVARLFGEVELLVMPTSTIGAPERSGFGDPRSLDHVHTFYWNSVGCPVLAVPGGFTADGLPIGLQFVGAAGADERLLAIGELFQSVTHHHLQRPPLDVANEGCRA